MFHQGCWEQKDIQSLQEGCLASRIKMYEEKTDHFGIRVTNRKVRQACLPGYLRLWTSLRRYKAWDWKTGVQHCSSYRSPVSCYAIQKEGWAATHNVPSISSQRTACPTLRTAAVFFVVVPLATVTKNCLFLPTAFLRRGRSWALMTDGGAIFRLGLHKPEFKYAPVTLTLGCLSISPIWALWKALWDSTVWF